MTVKIGDYRYVGSSPAGSNVWNLHFVRIRPLDHALGLLITVYVAYRAVAR